MILNITNVTNIFKVTSNSILQSSKSYCTCFTEDYIIHMLTEWRWQEALFYRNAWKPLRDFGVGLLDLHAVHIQDDLSIIALGFMEEPRQLKSKGLLKDLKSARRAGGRDRTRASRHLEEV